MELKIYENLRIYAVYYVWKIDGTNMSVIDLVNLIYL